MEPHISSQGNKNGIVELSFLPLLNMISLLLCRHPQLALQAYRSMKVENASVLFAIVSSVPDAWLMTDPQNRIFVE